MKTFVCGDTHGKLDLNKIHKWYNKNVDNLSKDDVFIQLGDWGAVWYNKDNIHQYKKDLELQLKWAKKKFTLAVVLGNHENYDLINKLPIEEKWGGKVRVLKPKNIYNPDRCYDDIYILQRGEIYIINNKKFLALGGASSQDKSIRTVGFDWWEEEIWNREEENNCINNLDKNNWQVDYVIAHTCPNIVGNEILKKMSKKKQYFVSAKSEDPLGKFFDFLVEQGLKFKEWHFGHWHEDIIIDKFQNNNNYIYQTHYLKEPFELK